MNHETLGNIIWDGSYVLCKFLEKRFFQWNKEGKPDYLLSSKTVLELGSGTGMVSLASFILGANTIASDLKEVLPLLEINLTQNKNSILQISKVHERIQLEVRELVWGRETDYQDLKGKLDFILGADVIAGIYPLDALLQTLDYLSNANTQIFIVYKSRFVSHEKKFFHKASKIFQISKVIFFLL